MEKRKMVQKTVTWEWDNFDREEIHFEVPSDGDEIVQISPIGDLGDFLTDPEMDLPGIPCKAMMAAIEDTDVVNAIIKGDTITLEKTDNKVSISWETLSAGRYFIEAIEIHLPEGRRWKITSISAYNASEHLTTILKKYGYVD